MTLKSNPKISIITPVYNQADYIEATILSVIEQGYPNLEYIIVDGGSTDGTIDIIKKYEKQITKWISEPDKGMYDALNKGFKLSTGDIMGWINSDDILLNRSLFNLAKIFTDVKKVNWVQCSSSYIDLSGKVINIAMPKRFSFLMFLNNDYKWIQQESTFWRRSLWERAGSKIDDNLKLAGDFELWFRFFQYDRLYNCNLPIGAWRKRDGQLSALRKDDYIKEINLVIETHNIDAKTTRALKQIKRLDVYISILKSLKIFNVNYLVGKRAKYYNIIDNEIYYSYMDRVFKTIY